ncbi:hypothetical protein ES703_97691 [subsurface metagenome]
MGAIAFVLISEFAHYFPIEIAVYILLYAFSAPQVHYLNKLKIADISQYFATA